MKQAIFSIALMISATTAPAQQVLTDAQVEQGYGQAIQARMEYRPVDAEVILTVLSNARPNAQQILFDLGVSQAEQGKCGEASRTFGRGEDLAQTPSFARAVETAMADLCPRLAPWEFNAGLNIDYDTNANLGAGRKEIIINGLPFILTDETVAQSGYGYTASAGAAYNFSITPQSYIVPTFSASLGDREGSDFDRLTLQTGVSYRHRGDFVDWRVGPTLQWTIDHDGSSEKGRGIAASADWTIDQRSGVYFSGSFTKVSNDRAGEQDHDDTYLTARYVRAVGEKGMVARVGLSFSKLDHKNDLQDFSSKSAFAGLSGPLNNALGFDIEAATSVGDGEIIHPVFGVVRHDNVATLTGRISFAELDGWYGRPYVGLTQSWSQSSIDIKDYSRTAITFGITRQF
ncbi:hypothetical protein ACOI1H_18450 [Loktanella sp. DJP18]|uniref:hypothetical protein n=1 Tax=Loktanella sp. DJP18 TaxID=3409788 RepID=UPI003BB68308